MNSEQITKETFKVIIKSIDENRLEIEVKRGAKISSVKTQIHQLTSIPFANIRLVYKAKLLADETSIEEIVSGDSEVFHLIAKTSGTIPAQTTQQNVQHSNLTNNRVHSEPVHMSLPNLGRLNSGPPTNPLTDQGQSIYNPNMHQQNQQTNPNFQPGLGFPFMQGMTITPGVPGMPLQTQTVHFGPGQPVDLNSIMNQLFQPPNTQINQPNQQPQIRPDVSLHQNLNLSLSDLPPVDPSVQSGLPPNPLEGLLSNLNNIVAQITRPVDPNNTQNQNISQNVNLQGLRPPQQNSMNPINPPNAHLTQNMPTDQMHQSQMINQTHQNHQVQNPNTTMGNRPHVHLGNQVLHPIHFRHPGHNQNTLRNMNTNNQRNTPTQTPEIPTGNPVIVNSTQTPRNVSSVTNQGITISIPSRSGIQQQLLNTQILRENETILRETDSFECEISRRIEPNNSATILGSYLVTLHDHLTRLLPNIKKCAKVLKSEQRIRNPEERNKANQIIKNVGKSFGKLQKIFAENAFLENFELKNSPGNFELKTNSPPLDNQQSEDDLEEQRRIDQQRRQLSNLTNMLQRGVPQNASLNQIAQLSGEVDEDEDFLSIVLGTMNITDNMELMMQNSLDPLDRNFSKIKSHFQNLIMKYENKDEKLKSALFKNETEDLTKSFLKYGKDMIFEGFEARPALNDIIDEFYPKLKTLMLGEFNSERRFSQMFGEFLKMLYGKIAYELSEGLDDGISSFHYIFKKSIMEYVAKIMGMEIPGFETMFEEKVWKHIFEGYLIQKSQCRNKEHSEALVRKLKDEKDDDDEGENEKKLSEEYLKGRFIE